jgi:4-amino-4-deoxy-L-arabinose transferase-like glycosyltransferase
MMGVSDRLAKTLDGLKKSRLAECLLVVVLVVGTFWYWQVSPEEAAALHQDAIDYAQGAINWIEGHGFTCSAYGRYFGMNHPFGGALVLVPAYLLFGTFVGNGIYAIAFYGLATLVMVYWLGRRLGGRWVGLFAALFLATHFGFRQYNQRMMVEVPTAFLVTLIFVVLVLAREWRHGWVGYLLAGTLVGLANSVRTDCLLLAGPVALLAVYGTWQAVLKRWVVIGVGLLPWLAAIGLYNQKYYGDYRWSGFNYWSFGDGTFGETEAGRKPLFSPRYLTARGYWTTYGFTPEQAKRMDGNFVANTKTLLNQADLTLPFGPVHWSQPKLAYQIIISVRTLIGLFGLAYCIWLWRSQPVARWFLIWLLSTGIGYYIFFLFWSQQEERYFLRFVPFFCVLNGMGIGCLFRLSQRLPDQLVRFGQIAARVFGFILIGNLAWATTSSLPYPGEIPPPRTQVMKILDRVIEANAVVLSTSWPSLVDLLLIHGTDRIQVPMFPRWKYFPGKRIPPRLVAEFHAATEPKRLAQLLATGRPCYLVLETTVHGAQPRPGELDAFFENYHLERIPTTVEQDGFILLSVKPRGGLRIDTPTGPAQLK